MVEIVIVDSVWAKTNSRGHYWLNNILCYNHVYWIKGPYQREKVVQKVYCLEVHSKDECWFHTGLVDRALEYLDKENVPYKFTNETDEVLVSDPSIEGYKFRDYQERLVNIAIDSGRGQIISPTASGKSVILMGIISAFPNSDVSLLVHTNDLVKQLKEDAIKAFPNENIGEWTGKVKTEERIMVATIQSYHKQMDKFADKPEVILIDEAHHVSDLYGMYGKVLSNSTALTKIGLTATRAASEKARWSAEALLGPIIGEYTQQEASRDKVIAVPDIWMCPTSDLVDLTGIKDYDDIYQWGIVANHSRHLKIVEIARKFIKQGRTCLIMISKIEQGERLAEIFADFDLEVPFVYGKSSPQERYEVKENLKDGSLRCAICSVVFIEGIDIPRLDTVINASGGVSPVQVVQKVGRALRKTVKKSKAIVVDFDDTFSASLKRQSDKRIAIYKSKGWKIVKKL